MNRSCRTLESRSSLAVVPHDKRPSEERTKLSSDNFKTTSIDDLSDFLLVEILCRLPCKKVVLRYKLVCKLWCSLLSDRYFMERFLCVRSKILNKQTLINHRGRELFTSSKRPSLSRLFERLMKSHSLEKEPYVLGTFNDLVLCCPTWYDQRDYYICNPYTAEWVSLPPPSQVYNSLPVGLICDLPYYNYNADTKGHNDIVQVNTEYRCKVVRILPFKNKRKYGSSFEFKVEIFSFETADWRESVASSPQEFEFNNINGQESFTYNGMLCWPAASILHDQRFIIGFDPFTMEDNNSKSIDGGDITHYYKCSFFHLVVKNPRYYQSIPLFGLSQGFPRVFQMSSGHNLYIWELKEATAGYNRSAGKLSLIYPSIHSLDKNLFEDDHTWLIQMDPNVKDILYLRVQNNIAKCNINTGEWSIIAPYTGDQWTQHFFPSTELPWPTPVPTLPPTNKTYICREKGYFSDWRLAREDDDIFSFFSI